MFNNKVIFISGGTGSFGNRFLEKLLKDYKPKKIIIFSRDEYKQFINHWNKDGNEDIMWICKPTDGSRGQGIHIVSKMDDIKYT